MTAFPDLTPEDAFADALDAMVLGFATSSQPSALDDFALALQAMPHTDTTSPDAPPATPLDAATRQRIWRDLMRDQATSATPPQTPGTPSSALSLNPWVGPEPVAAPASKRPSSRALRFVPSFQTSSSVVIMVSVLALIFASFSVLLDEDDAPPTTTPGFGSSTPTNSAEDDDFSFLQPISPDECVVSTPIPGESMETASTTHDYVPVTQPNQDIAYDVAQAARNYFACFATGTSGLTDSIQTEKHQIGLSSNVPAYIANVNDIRALSEAVMSEDPLTYFIQSPLAPRTYGEDPATAMESLPSEDDRIWMAYLPEQAALLADGRVGIPMNYLIPPDIITLTPEFGFLLISYEIYASTESGSWLRDETFWLCSGSCDAFWSDPAAYLTASQVVTPPFAEDDDFSFMQPISPDECLVTESRPADEVADILLTPAPDPAETYAPVEQPSPAIAEEVAYSNRQYSACRNQNVTRLTSSLESDRYLQTVVELAGTWSGGEPNSELESYTERVPEIRALSDAIMSSNPLDYFPTNSLVPDYDFESTPSVSETGTSTADLLPFAYLPEQAVLLEDGRVGLPQNYSLPENVLAGPPETGFLLIGFNIFTQSAQGTWLLDEHLWLCSGTCDTYWADPATILNAGTSYYPLMVKYAPGPFADSNQNASTGRSSFTPDPAFDAENITAHGFLSDPERQTQSLAITGNLLLQQGEFGFGGVDDPPRTAIWVTDLTTGHQIWTVEGTFTGKFATAGGTVFIVERDETIDPPTFRLVALSLKTGERLPLPSVPISVIESADNFGPIVVGNTVIISDALGSTTAIDATSGEVIWQVEGERGDTPSASSTHPGAHGGALVSDGEAIYVTTGADTVRKLNATTGEVIWEQSLVEHLPDTFNGETAEVALHHAPGRLVVRATSLVVGSPETGKPTPMIPEVLMLLDPASGEVLQANPHADIAGNIAIADDRVVVPTRSVASVGVDIQIWYLDRPHTVVFGNVVSADSVAITATGGDGSTLLLQSESGDVYVARMLVNDNPLGLVSDLPVERIRNGTDNGTQLAPIVNDGVAWVTTSGGGLVRIVPGTDNFVPDNPATPVAEIPGVIQGSCEQRSSPNGWAPEILREYAIANTFSRAALLDRNSIAPFFENAAACRVQRPHSAEFSSFTIPGYTTGTLDDSLTNEELRQHWIFPLTPSSMNASYLWEAPAKDGDPATVLTVVPNSARNLTDGRVGVLVTLAPHTISTLPDATWNGTFGTPPTVNFVAMLAGTDGWYVDEFIPMCEGAGCIPFYAEDPSATQEAPPPSIAPTYPPAEENEDVCTPAITMEMPGQPSGTPDPNDPCTMDCDPMEVNDGLPTPAGCVVLYDDVTPTAAQTGGDSVRIDPLAETPTPAVTESPSAEGTPGECVDGNLIWPAGATPPSTTDGACRGDDSTRGGDTVRIEPFPETPTPISTEPPG